VAIRSLRLVLVLGFVIAPTAALSRPSMTALLHPKRAPKAPSTVAACKDREACKKSCSAGDLSACFAFGQDLLIKTSPSEARDPAAASHVFLDACERGHAGACLELAGLRTHGLGGPIDLEAAAAAAREACDRGLDPACAVVAENAFFATGQRRDTGLAHLLARRAEAATRKACTTGDGIMCMLAADLADTGLIAGGPAAVRGFRAEAQRLLQPRCEREDGIACLWLAVGQPLGRSTAKLQRACELGVARACSVVAVSLLGGYGVERDAALGMADWKSACDANDRWACAGLCAHFSAGKSKDEAAARPFCDRTVSLFTRVCDLGSGEGCAQLASFYQDGVGVPVDQDRAKALYAAAVEPLRSECEAHHAFACGFLGRIHERGLGAPKDVAARLRAERMQCDAGDASACASYAERLRKGDLVERSNERAKFYDAKACDLGYASSCTAAFVSLTIAQKQPSPPVSCPPDQTAEEGSPNHCCFARQVWSDEGRRCVGEPACPEGMVARDGTCRQNDQNNEANEARETADDEAHGEPVATNAEPAAKATRTPQTSTDDCSGCATACTAMTGRCQTDMRACYEAAACLCRCQRERGGCGMSSAALDQCVGENVAQASRLSSSAAASAR
jgi:TPR repeat protein